ncbi:hypothetical protein SCA6_012930 [Theobroma cacao]
MIATCHNGIDIDMFQAKDNMPLGFSLIDSRYQCKEAEDEGSIEILECTAPCQKTREKSSIQCPRPQKMMKINMINKTEKILESEYIDPLFRPFCNKACGIKLEEPKGSTSSSCCKQEVGLKPATRTGTSTEKGWECPEQAEILRSQKLTAKVKAKTLRIAKAFNSKNPFFLVVIQPSHISRNYKMCIPSNFARKYFTKTHGGETVLCLSDGKSWSVKYYRRGDDGNPQGQFSGGWKKFALDNNLVVGDVCVFELLKGADISFKVFIHRVVDVANCDPSQGLKRHSCSSSPAPPADLRLFRRIVQPSHLYLGRVDIPFKFIEKYFKPDTKNVILRVASRLWPVKMIISTHSRLAKLATGWTGFATENSLKVGDICVFKLINSSDAMFNVSIFRKDGSEGSPGSNSWRLNRKPYRVILFKKP